MGMKKAAVIGSGIGGIAASIRLRAKGYEVDVFEAKDFLGGKLAEKTLGEYRFDMGPSLFTLPNLVEELYQLLGEDINDHFQYTRLDPICKYFWDDGKEFTAPADKNQFVQNLSSTFGTDTERVNQYLNDLKKRYELTAPTFLEKSLHKSSTWLSKELIEALGQFHKLGIFSTLHKLNKGYFKEPHVVQLFDRYATYNGSSPYLTPGVMSVIPYLEYYLGAYFPKKGMRSIPMSLVELGKRHGVNYHTHSLVEEIIVVNKKAEGVKVNGQNHKYDLVVSDMDIVPTYRRLLKKHKAPEKTLALPRSASALIFYWGINREFPDLDVHNIFFSKDYKEEFRHQFELEKLYHDPTIYVHISNKSTGIDCPKGKENWFVMINCHGHHGEKESEDWIQKARDYNLKKLNARLGVNLQDYIEEESWLSPWMIEDRTFSYRGSLYGTASNSMFSGLLRHPNFSQRIKNLYFCGGSVHPGGGIPLSMSSAKIVDSLISPV
jgi:phytoene desaturase